MDIGTCHVMRCLTLAARGHERVFYCRELPGHLIDIVKPWDRDVRRLRVPDGSRPTEPDALAHAGWLGVHWKEDAAEVAALLRERPPDWLVVGHYALDARWGKAALPEGTQLMAIDNLADRPHRADLQLDQNLGRRDDSYGGLVPEGCRVIVELRFAHARCGGGG